jgi:hypothetical protein
MNSILRQKIKQLYNSGHKTLDSIRAALNKRSETYQVVNKARPLYMMEAGFFQMLVPAVITLQELAAFSGLTSAQREGFVKQKLDLLFTSAQSVEDKMAALKLGLELQNYKNLLEKSGSMLFDDPNFAKATYEDTEVILGSNWLEENGVGEPSNEEIMEAVTT